MATVFMPNLLHCNVPSPGFWVSWSNSKIQLGTGFPYSNVMLEWSDNDGDRFTDRISKVRIGTANGEAGRWMVNRYAGIYTDITINIKKKILGAIIKI